MLRPVTSAAAAAAVLLPLCLPAWAGPNDAEKKADRERRRQEAIAAAERDARVKRAEEAAAKLHTGDPLERFYAAWDLQALLPDSREALLRVLKEQRNINLEEDLTEAVGAVGEAALADALPDLQSVVRDGKVGFRPRLAAVLAIAKLMTGDAQVFLDQVATSDDYPPELRGGAVMALGMIEAPTTGRTAEALTHHADPMLRMMAYRAIGWSKDRRYVGRCVEGLNDPVPLTASMAAKALGRIGDPSTTDKLVAVAQKARARELWFFILEALGRLAHQPSLDELLRLVQDPKFEGQVDAATFLYEIGERRALPIFRALMAEALKGKQQPGLDTLLAYALAAMEDADAAPVLRDALRLGRGDTRREAAFALGRLGDAGAVPELTALAAGTPDRLLRVRALLALGKLRTFDLSRPIQTALADRDAAVRWSAVVALESRGDPTAIPALRPLLKDPRVFVSRAAREAIAVLEGTPSIEVDPRRENILVRLRALERELVLRERANATLEVQTWVDVVSWEAYYSTCGGTHPPVEVGRTMVVERRVNVEAAEEMRRRRELLDDTYDLRVMRGDGQRVREQTHGRERDGEDGGKPGGRGPAAGGGGAREER